MSGASATESEPWTILRLLQWTTEHLKKNGSSSPRLDAEVLLAHARNCQRIELYTAFAEEPDEKVKASFRELIKRRASGEPVAYLVGKKEFYSLTFKVNAGCLIPRGETEHLVIECLDRAKAMSNATDSKRPWMIADVCTGSGCIAVTIAKQLPQSRVIAIDVSEKALAVAQENIDQFGLADRIELRCSDLLASVEDQSLDFVLSNPPYVSRSEFAKLEKTVREHEPEIALVSGETGTEIIERLIAESETKLKPGGWFLCELSPMIADRVLSLLQASAEFENPGLVKDLAGHKRVAIAQRKVGYS
jgi:release factor glutamine methyltransferase